MNSSPSPSAEQVPGQFGCIQLFLLCFPLAYGTVSGISVGLSYGWLYGLLAGVLGYGIGLGLGVAVVWLVGALFALAYPWLVAFPACRVCTELDDYEWLETTDQGRIFKCRHCGAIYKEALEGGTFMEVSSDGAVRPYMKRRFLRGWQRERS